MRLTLEEVAFNHSNRKEFSHLSDLLCQEQKELIEYKTLEEELGIDLVTLFKALKEGIYGKIGNKIEHILAPHLSWHNSEIYIFKIKDYGKTWALTKEELKNDKEN